MRSNSGRRRFIKGAGLTGTIALAGCISSTDNNGGGDETDTATPTEESGSTETESGDGTATETEDDSNAGADVNVGMVYATGGLGDKSFNDMARQGALQAEEELGISFDQAQPEQNSDFSPAQRQFAESGDYDLISCIGFAQTDALTQNADRYSDQHFQIVDSVVDTGNVASYVFMEHEGSFQVGHLAGLLTSQSFEAGQGSTTGDSTNVGFVGGLDVPLIRKFQAGYEAGVEYANEDVDVQTSYVGSFNDAATAREAALSMYDSGADIVYHAAGASGLGVFQAAQERGKFAIGVDADQSRSEPDFADWILASMVKRVDTAVYTAIESEVDGEFGGGSVTTLGLESDGVACVYGEALGDAIPQDVKDQIAASRQAIIDDEISVPTEP
ncbi:BMP family lipoprotein [Haloarchaeobius litoreus]|uniref:BMP family protein n=1 Tax=Haloarchaeobius litoreus TaxID=755306 RepID=A0ABD6DH47_9EURY|nr:BMP family protein [Haloarchaeobius litoreus]